MHAVVEIAGVQHEVAPNQKLNVPYMRNGQPGQTLTFANVLLVKDGNDTTIGAPYTGAQVSAKVIEHTKDDTILVFHKKRRKGYRKLNGHRQKYTRIEITEIKA